MSSFDIDGFLKSLCAIPHRAAGSEGEQRTLRLLEEELAKSGVEARREVFRAPRTYIPLLWWLSGVLALAILVPHWASFALAIVFFWGAWRYFDWRKSFLTSLPPSINATNLWAAKGEGPKRLILMAHHDSAPASFAYRPSQVKNFRQSVITGLVIMALCVVWSALQLLGFQNFWVSLALLVMLAIQMVVATVDFVLYGYTNAANDNGTGVAAVLATARELWADVPSGWSVEVLLTGAEESGMIGAQKWVDAHIEELKSQQVYVLNIDTVGAGRLCFVEKTGTLTTLDYENPVVDAARALSSEDERFSDVEAKAHRVADFDSVWFARKSIPVLTLGAYDENGLMPHIHRPEDVLEHVDTNIVRDTVEFATALSQRIMAG